LKEQLPSLELFAPTPDCARDLQGRLREFERAMAAGGARDAYEQWRATCMALAAALEIASASGAAVHETKTTSGITNRFGAMK
jgi:predicted MarR family transcription regulator